MKQPKFPVLVKRGSAVVKIYRTPTKGYDSFTLSYYVDGVRRRPTFPTLDQARTEAEIKATELTRGDLDTAKLTSADCASYTRAKELLAPTGLSIELAAAQMADAVAKLGAVPLATAVQFYLHRNNGVEGGRTVQAVVEEFLAVKRQDGLSARYLKTLDYELKQFRAKFSGTIADVRGGDIEAWLRGTEWSPRTRNNFRNTLQTVFNFAKAKRYMPKDHDELAAVSVAKERDEEIEIYTPRELQELLTTAEARFVPFIALGAFAGIRHAEIQRLDWQDVRLANGVVEIHAGKAKTASRRTVPILPCLRAWLELNRRESGPVCAYKSMSEAFRRIEAAVNAERAKRRTGGGAQEFKWKHNALRHSFISYRVAQIQNVAQVALEAGNSPQMIFKHYRELVRPKEAEAWFNIMPAPGQVAEALHGVKNVVELKQAA
jgi:integrase